MDANDFERRYLGVGTSHWRQMLANEGGKRVLKRVNQMGKAVSRLHTIWVDGGFDGEPFMRWVMDVCRWIVQVVHDQSKPKDSCLKTLGSRAHFRLDDEHSAIGERL